jgi:uncharacterized protein
VFSLRAEPDVTGVAVASSSSRASRRGGSGVRADGRPGKDDRPRERGGRDDPLIVSVRVKPGASRTRVGGVHAGAKGPALVIAVTAPAVDGRATEAARRALAEALDVPLRWLALQSGASSRDKLFSVAAPADDMDGIVARMRRLRDG